MLTFSDRPKITVVIPTLNEASHIEQCLASVQTTLPKAEIIVVDGGSSDDTVELASKWGVTVLSARRGRGTQCNIGGQRASGDLIVFLHADTTLPDNASTVITTGFRDGGTRVATFRMKFDDDHILLRIYSFFTRFDSAWFKFGDQAIIIRRELFSEIGGFPDWPLLEDVELLRRLRISTRIRILPASVTTSARRLRKDGLLRRQLRNGMILARFMCGTSPFVISDEYEHNSSSGIHPLHQIRSSAVS
jgi:rSAM/selenodomain-associated transferase 2